LEEIETQQLTARLAAMRSVLCGQERSGQKHKCFYPAQEAHSSKPQDVMPHATKRQNSNKINKTHE
jgi:hypothetical protein